MGAWTPTSFGNDAAMDLLLRLEAFASPGEILKELGLCFDRYAAYESLRLQGKNVYTTTAEHIELLLSKIDPEYLDDEFSERVRSTVGSLAIDDGAHEASEAIAAAEVALACATLAYDRIPDGQFLATANCRVSQQDLAAAIEAIETIKLNRGLGQQSGAAWRRNLKDLSIRLSLVRAADSRP